MIKSLKSNKFIIIFLFAVCFIFILNPSTYANSCLNALSVWAFKVLPMLFPFFVFTRLIVSLVDTNNNPLDKFFSNVYNTPKGSFLIFFLSILSGYPMGAKLISALVLDNKINNDDAKKLFSICSVSGPMFIIGTVGIGIFNNYKVGVIILICNIIACLINGFLFSRNKPITHAVYSCKTKTTSLSDCVYDSLISILIVGSYIVLSFLFVDLIKNLTLLQNFISTICSVFPIEHLDNIVNAIISCVFEITRGAIDISASSLSLQAKTIITSSSIAFGGVSILLQSMSFLKCSNIDTKTFLKMKISQALICLLVSVPIVLIFL